MVEVLCLLRMLPFEIQVKHTNRKMYIYIYVSFSTSIKMVKEMQRLFDVTMCVFVYKWNGNVDRRKNENR